MSNVVWGGRFEGPPNKQMMAFTSSLAVDLRLLPYDCRATAAHARALVAAGLLEPQAVEDVDEVLSDIVARAEAGETVAADDEDVHSLVERVLTERLGDVGRRIHAGRSRNDLVATDLRLWCKDAAAALAAEAGSLIGTLCDLGEEHLATLMPGYTHLQRAQPVTLAFHLAAHGFALARDLERFRRAREAADVSALGAGALATNTLGLDAKLVAEHLGLGRTFDNATDAVADRDFAVDLVYACALCMVHLSRLAEEIVLWTSAELSFARLSDDWSTGSSMMPQKRNPDVAELVRGRAAGAIGSVTTLLTLLKGLPLAYDRDLQEDKEVVFDAVDRTGAALAAIKGLVASLTFDAEVLAGAAAGGGSWATDLAEALVKQGTPFRVAHETAGRVAAAVDRGEALDEALRSADVHGVEPADLADPAAAVARRSGPGGPSSASVAEQIARLRELAQDAPSEASIYR